jgi:hypothetical protein
MGIKQVHLLIITASIVFSVIFGFWILQHNYPIVAYGSFAAATALTVYCVKFINKTKALK